jgi:hypothetical protein
MNKNIKAIIIGVIVTTIITLINFLLGKPNVGIATFTICCLLSGGMYLSLDKLWHTKSEADKLSKQLKQLEIEVQLLKDEINDKK